MKIEQKSLDVSLDSEKDYDNNSYYFILSALLVGRSIYEKIKVNDGEQKQLVDNIFKQCLKKKKALDINLMLVLSKLPK